jgi:uncharacterized membrane protein
MPYPKRRSESKNNYDFLTPKDLKTFSDAIFAFAITLLAIDIRVQAITGNISAGQLNSELINLIPRLIGFVLTFFIGCLYWISYHRILHFVKKLDGRMVLLNILFLMFVVLLPFPNDLLGRYVSFAISAIIEAIILASMGIVSGLMWIYASSNHRLIDNKLSDEFIKKLTLRLFVAPAVFIISIPLTFILPFSYIALFWVLVIPLNILLQRGQHKSN